jgi:hypothetical protein
MVHIPRAVGEGRNRKHSLYCWQPFVARRFAGLQPPSIESLAVNILEYLPHF